MAIIVLLFSKSLSFSISSLETNSLWTKHKENKINFFTKYHNSLILKFQESLINWDLTHQIQAICVTAIIKIKQNLKSKTDGDPSLFSPSFTPMA